MNKLPEPIYSLKKGDKYGYIDLRGNWVVDPIFDFAYDFEPEAELTPFVHDGKDGFIDRAGAVVIVARYEDSEYFESDNLARVKINGKWGCINKDGVFVIKPEFENIGVFSECNLAMAEMEGMGKKGYIDLNSSWAIDPIFDRAWPFTADNVARVLYKGGVGVIDTQGDWVVAPKFDKIEFRHKLIFLEAFIDSEIYSGYASLDGEYVAFEERMLERILNRDLHKD